MTICKVSLKFTTICIKFCYFLTFSLCWVCQFLGKINFQQMSSSFLDNNRMLWYAKNLKVSKIINKFQGRWSIPYLNTCNFSFWALISWIIFQIRNFLEFKTYHHFQKVLGIRLNQTFSKFNFLWTRNCRKVQKKWVKMPNIDYIQTSVILTPQSPNKNQCILHKISRNFYFFSIFL